IGRGRASVQGVEERSVDPSHLSPARNPNRSPYFHCVSGLLSAGHAETAAEDAGAGIDGEGRARKTRRHADDRCRTAHDGRSGGRLVPLYGAREGSVAPASAVEAPTSRSAAAENHCPEQPRSRGARSSPVEPTFEAASQGFQQLGGAQPPQLVKSGYHQLESRIEAHIFIAFLAYCLLVTLKQRLK